MEVKKIIERKNESMKSELGRLLAFYAAHWILKSKKKNPKPLQILAGGVLLYVGVTGKVPFATWFRRVNQNHSQLNCKVEVTIQQPPALVFAYFQDFTHAKRYFPWIKDIAPLDGEDAGWHVEAKWLGLECAWDTYIVKERPDEFLGWSTDADALFYNTGKIEVSPGSSADETVLDFVFSYTPPGGKLGNKLAQPLHGLIQRYVERYIRRVKKDLDSLVCG